jgi:predicted deacetylase
MVARPSSEPLVRVVFRYDDCSARSSLTLERDFVGAFAACGAQVSLAVIPFVCAGDFHNSDPQQCLPLPPAKAAFLRAAARDGHAEIALHGYSHQRSNLGRATELAGLGLAEQRRRLGAGKEFLDNHLGTDVTTLVPPWNAYDEATLRAAAAVGIDCISASLRGPFCGRPVLDFLPFSTWLRGLPIILAAAHQLRRLAPVLVIMMHDFDFFESGDKQAWLSVIDFAALIRELTRAPGVHVCSLRQACREGVGFHAEDLVPHQLWRGLWQRLAYPYRVLLEDQVLWARRPLAASFLSVWSHQTYVSCQRLWPVVASSLRRRLRNSPETKAGLAGPSSFESQSRRDP